MDANNLDDSSAKPVITIDVIAINFKLFFNKLFNSSVFPAP